MRRSKVDRGTSLPPRTDVEADKRPSGMAAISRINQSRHAGRRRLVAARRHRDWQSAPLAVRLGHAGPHSDFDSPYDGNAEEMRQRRRSCLGASNPAHGPTGDVSSPPGDPWVSGDAPEGHRRRNTSCQVSPVGGHTLSADRGLCQGADRAAVADIGFSVNLDPADADIGLDDSRAGLQRREDVVRQICGDEPAATRRGIGPA